MAASDYVPMNKVYEEISKKETDVFLKLPKEVAEVSIIYLQIISL